MKSASAQVQLKNAAGVLDALRLHLAEHKVQVEYDGTVARATLSSGIATLRLEASSLSIRAEAATEAGLGDVAGFLASHVIEFAHPERPAIRWAGYTPSGLLADFRELTVVAAAELTPHMRRITLRGTDLERFDTLANLHVRLFFPPPGLPPVWPMRGEDGVVQPIEPERRPVVRKYTIRRIDTAKRLVEIDFVLHEVAGPGSDWARRAGPGDLLGMAGPGGRGARPADWMLLAGDETALPAMARILESLSPHARGRALVEVEDGRDEIELSRPEGFDLKWVHRGAGGDLVSAVMQVPVAAGPDCFCWAGAEFAQVQAIRRHWVATCGVAKADQLAVAYWRRGVAEG